VKFIYIHTKIRKVDKMQTFVPYPNIAASAAALDYRRLGKQRVETFQILRANLGMTAGWSTHPASRMWANNAQGLIAYGVAMCDEWIARGYKDTTRAKILELGAPDAEDMPSWWGDNAVHSSHRSNLLRKDSLYYSQFGWEDDPSAAYVWPMVVS
jgi:hypothetical protein